MFASFLAIGTVQAIFVRAWMNRKWSRAVAPTADTVRRGAIIGIIVAFAVAIVVAGATLLQSSSSNNAAAQSDARNLISSLEQCNTDYATYPWEVTADGVISGCDQTVDLSSGSTVAAGAATPHRR